MARQPSYAELFKHPKWQRKRLAIMERADFVCEHCESQDTTLNVHHTYYEKGKKPWEYPDDSLWCLCEACHAEMTTLMAKIHREFGRLMWGELEQVYGYVQGIQISNWEHPRPIDCPTLDCASGLGHALGVDETYVDQFLREGDYSYQGIFNIQHKAFEDQMDMFYAMNDGDAAKTPQTMIVEET